jgi:hypothetical protein
VAKRSDDELILYVYGEHASPEELERELAADPELSSRHDALRRELRALDHLAAPEPRPGLEARMWARVAPSLAKAPGRFAVPSGWLGWAALGTAVLTIGFVGFMAGRVLHEPPTERAVAETLKALPPAARDRVLDEGRAGAGTLLSANRLYRRAAEHAGQRRVAAVLAELEPFLAQLADAPESFDLRRSQERIESGDLLFKVRITRNNLKELS